jgi:hypothetical protein
MAWAGAGMKVSKNQVITVREKTHTTFLSSSVLSMASSYVFSD